MCKAKDFVQKEKLSGAFWFLEEVTAPSPPHPAPEKSPNKTALGKQN